MGPGDLDITLCGMDIPEDPRVLAGLRGSEDAGVYKLDDETALVQTLDFFTPIVDDPRVFGRAAAANSLSDVYAMGGRPITAMNIVCFPAKKLGLDVLRSILAGGLDILREAGVALVGGHSVQDDEPKYGLSVTGLVHPQRIMSNGGLRPGDRLILTKAVGTGIIATSVKGGLASEESTKAMIDSMCALNKKASEAAVSLNVRACTDITGFGLAGHLVEMVRAGHCRARIRAHAIPILEGARDYAAMGLIPAGAHANRKYFKSWITMDPSVPLELADLMFDPQTSGGLVLGVSADRSEQLQEALTAQGVPIAADIGEVLSEDPEGHLEIV
jgi:selenide, water dikinase